MRAWTYAELKAKVLDDLDMNDEDFITSEEWLEYCNEAIDRAEQIIHTLGRESIYFLSSANISLVSGTAAYSLPSDIYANKIVSLVYDDGTDKDEIKRLKNLKDIPWIQTSDWYRYLLINTAASGYQIKFYPTSRVTSATALTIWYIRNAKKFTTTSDVLDCPEAANYIMQYMKVRAYEKEGHPNVVKAAADLDREEELLRATLAEMVVDGDTNIPIDEDFYLDHV